MKKFLIIIFNFLFLFTSVYAETFSQALKKAYQTTFFYITEIAHSLKSAVSSRNFDGFVGPIMAIATGSKGAQKGFTHLLLLLAIISINLAIMNLLPLPIFDGGQILIFTIETLLGRELSEPIRNAIGIVSWTLIIGLLVLFTVKDIYILFFK